MLEQDFLKRDEVAAIFKVKPVTVWKWQREGSIAFVKIGGTTRFPRAEIEAMLKRQSFTPKSHLDLP